MVVGDDVAVALGVVFSTCRCDRRCLYRSWCCCEAAGIDVGVIFGVVVGVGIGVVVDR